MRAKRTDANHAEILMVLRELGWHVMDTHRLPNFVDAVARRRDQLRLIEIKTEKGSLTASQQKLLDDGWPLHILRSVDDAINLR